MITESQIIHGIILYGINLLFLNFVLLYFLSKSMKERGKKIK